MRVYLADLGHNQVTMSSDTYPLGVANLATYLTAGWRSQGPLDVRIFREPEDLKAALDGAPPDVLGLSSYGWNHNLSTTFARYAKRKHPGIITMMGGPNFPLTTPEQESWMRTMPEIDAHVRGPTYEGERAFLNIMLRLADVGGSLEGLQEQVVDGSQWIHKKTGDFVAGGPVNRILDLDEIPSPYLAGLMDPFWKTGYFPLMQIARGCPFTCQFCNSSVKSNSKVYAHSLENMRADLIYAAERVDKTMALSFADDNFGMYELDVEVADVIAWCQDTYGWPKYIRTTTGKNRGERIIQVMRKIRGALPMTAAVQSMSPVVLENIKRSNIKLETYTEIQKEVRAQGMQSYGEMILGLPGETKESFMKGISDLLDTGVLRVSAHQLMLLHGAPLNNPDQRERFGFTTRFRVVARDVGDYGVGEPVVETEEMVVESATLTFEDYLEVRVFHLLLSTFYYEGNIEEAFAFAKERGVKAFDIIVRLQQMLDRAPAGFRKVIDDFVVESKEELFETREAVVEWAKDRLPALISGELGGNLLSKYSMLGRFYATHEGLDFLQLAIAESLGDRLDAEGRDELAAVMDYLRTVLLHVPFRETMRRTPSFTAAFDVEGWRDADFARPLASFRLPAPLTWRTAMDEEKRAVIEKRISDYGEHASGLGKFSRTMFAKDLRRKLVPNDAAVPA
ncbi:MAG: cobalamin-dependent protein [Gemmatimonadaceae bacterium]